MWNHMGDWGWGWIVFGGLHMLLLWVLIIGVVVLLARSALGGRRRGDDDDALAILKKRYARGEIDRAEYERMRKDLEG